MAKFLLPFTLVLFLLYTKSHAKPEFDTNDVRSDIIKRLTVVRNSKLPDASPEEKQLTGNILLPSESNLDEPDDSIHVGLDLDTVDEKEVVPEKATAVFEEKEPDPDHFLGTDLEEQVVSSEIEDSKEPLTRFHPINRRFHRDGTKRAFRLFRLPHNCHHRHQIPMFRQQRPVDQESDNTAVPSNKGRFLPRKQIPARWVQRSTFDSDDHLDQGMMIDEFKQPRRFFHHRHQHHHHHRHEDEDRDQDDHHHRHEDEDRDQDGMLAKIRKFLTHL